MSDEDLTLWYTVSSVLGMIISQFVTNNGNKSDNE